MVLPDSNRVSRAPSYSSKTHIRSARFRIHDFHVLWLVIQTILLTTLFSYLTHYFQFVILGQITKENFSALTLSCVISQPLIHIRLKTYLPSNKLPGKNVKGLDSSSFARHYSRNHYLFSLPQPTKMFQFSWFPSNLLYIQRQIIRHDSYWVSPFGYSRIKACWQLPETFRSLPRPSSVIYI